MAAKNIKNRNLANEINNSISKEVLNQSTRLREYAPDLQSKQVTKEYVKEHSRHNEFIDKLNRQTKRAENNVNAQQKRYNELLQERISMKATNTAEALLEETRATKIWNRIERDLAKQNNAQRLTTLRQQLTDAVKANDYTTVAVINAEAPSYLRSDGFTKSEALIEGVIRTYDDELGQAHHAVTEAAGLHTLARHNTQVASNAFTRSIDSDLKAIINDPTKMEGYIDTDTALGNPYQEATDALQVMFQQAEVQLSTDTSDPDAEPATLETNNNTVEQ